MKMFTFAVMFCIIASQAASAIEVHDTAGKIPGPTAAALNEKRYSFDSKVFTGSWSSRDDLKAFLHAQTGPMGVSVGIDPSHHMTEIWSGPDVNLSSGVLSQVSTKGNPFFRNDDWGSGINAIFESLADSVMTNGLVRMNTAAAQQIVVHVDNPTAARTEMQVDSTSMTWLLGTLIFAGFLLTLWTAITVSRRARRKAAENLEKKYQSDAATGKDMSLFKDRPSLAYEMGRAQGQTDGRNAALDSELLRATTVPSVVVINTSPHVDSASSYIAPEPTHSAPTSSYDSGSSGGSSYDSGSSGGSSWDSGSSGGGGFDSGSGGDSGGSSW